MADHQVESAPFGHVSTAKQTTFQVAPRVVGRFCGNVNPFCTQTNVYSVRVWRFTRSFMKFIKSRAISLSFLGILISKIYSLSLPKKLTASYLINRNVNEIALRIRRAEYISSFAFVTRLKKAEL